MGGPVSRPGTVLGQVVPFFDRVILQGLASAVSSGGLRTCEERRASIVTFKFQSSPVWVSCLLKCPNPSRRVASRGRLNLRLPSLWGLRGACR